MSKKTIELTYDQIDKIVVEELEWQKAYFEEELKNFYTGAKFVHPEDAETHIEDLAAVKRLLRWWTV
jgi:hypothetical protein